MAAQHVVRRFHGVAVWDVVIIGAGAGFVAFLMRRFLSWLFLGLIAFVYLDALVVERVYDLLDAIVVHSRKDKVHVGGRVLELVHEVPDLVQFLGRWVVGVLDLEMLLRRRGGDESPGSGFRGASSDVAGQRLPVLPLEGAFQLVGEIVLFPEPVLGFQRPWQRAHTGLRAVMFPLQNVFENLLFGFLENRHGDRFRYVAREFFVIAFDPFEMLRCENRRVRFGIQQHFECGQRIGRPRYA